MYFYAKKMSIKEHLPFPIFRKDSANAAVDTIPMDRDFVDNL